MDGDGGTFLEDFLLSLEMVPNNVRRDCELLKVLDREYMEVVKDIDSLEQRYIGNLHRLQYLSMQTTAPSSSSGAISTSAVPAPVASSATTPPTQKKRKRGATAEVAAITTSTAVEVQEGSSATTTGESQQVHDLHQQNISIEKSLGEYNERANRLLAEKTSIATALISFLSQYMHKLDVDLSHFAGELKGVGEYEAPRGIPVDSEVAFKINLDQIEKTLILGRVINYRSEINCYEILDVDDLQKYTLPETQVLALGQADGGFSFHAGSTIGNKKLSKGEVVFALYPDTTIFYPATVVQPPRKTYTSVHSLPPEPTVSVQFIGDEDETGLIPIRVLPLRHIVRAPQFL